MKETTMKNNQISSSNHEVAVTIGFRAKHIAHNVDSLFNQIFTDVPRIDRLENGLYKIGADVQKWGNHR